MTGKFPIRLIAVLLALLLAAVFASGCEAARKRRQQEREFRAQIKAYNAQVKDPLDKVVCKKIEPTGSHIPKLVCKTRREWSRIRRGSQRAVEELRPTGRKSDQ